MNTIPRDPDDHLIFLSIPEVADRLGVDPRTVRNFVDQGKLQAIKLGDSAQSTIRISLAALKDMVDRYRFAACKAIPAVDAAGKKSEA